MQVQRCSLRMMQRQENIIAARNNLTFYCVHVQLITSENNLIGSFVT